MSLADYRRSHSPTRLFHGNFVLDSAVPISKDECEFTHMRYSTVTGDPNNFKNNGFTHRQDLSRRAEPFIVTTMYNEDDLG